MGTPVYPQAVYDTQGETATLSSTVPTVVAVQPGYQAVDLWCTTAWKLLLTPKIQAIQYFVGTTFNADHTTKGTDKVSTTHVPLDAMLATDILYVLTTDVIGGLRFDMVDGEVNAIAATLDIEYWKTAGWTDVSGDSDGTVSSSATLAVDGNYTWTAPTDATKDLPSPFPQNVFYAVRFKPSTTLSATVSLQEVIPMHKNTNYANYPASVDVPVRVSINQAKVGALQILSASATPTMNINWIRA